MRITDIETHWLRIPLPCPLHDSTHALELIDLILVTVRAGDYHGMSYMLSFNYAPTLLKGVVDCELRKHVVGRCVDDIGSIHDSCLSLIEYVGQEGLAKWGVSAIDTALWDLLARRLNVPVSVLFGRHPCHVPAYGSGGWLSYTDEQLADEVARHLERGYAGVKIKIAGPTEDFDVARVQAVRRAIGPEKMLMVDANQGLTLERAIRTCRRIEQFDTTWIEEPFDKDDVESYCRLAAATTIRLAAGEREYSISRLRRLMEAGVIGVVQPDLMRIGGVTGWRQTAHLSSAFRLRLAPHFYKEFDVHLAASVPNLVAIEAFDWLDPLLEHPLEVQNGSVLVPERSGFGIEFRSEAMAEYSHA